MGKIAFVVHENGQASLIVDGQPMVEVGRSSGLDEAMNLFNNLMRKRNLAYRLESGWSEMMKKLLENDS
jgi:hypothetical protein